MYDVDQLEQQGIQAQSTTFSAVDPSAQGVMMVLGVMTQGTMIAQGLLLVQGEMI